MSLSDELADLRKPVLTCRVCRWYAAQSEDDRAEFDSCVASGRVQKKALLGVCRGHGLDCSDSTFREHIREHHGKAAL